MPINVTRKLAEYVPETPGSLNFTTDATNARTK
jgi:hypothetical protein